MIERVIVRMRVIFYPPHSNSNDYVKLATEALESNDCEIINKRWEGDLNLILKSILSVLKNKKVIFHFNWLEENAAHKGAASFVKSRLILLFLYLFHILGGKVVWTMHNAKSHNGINARQDEFIRSFLKWTSLVIVHCTESAEILTKDYHFPENKILFVPHGNYCKSINNYVHDNNHKDSKVHFLYFGAISKYKGVPYLIKAFDCEYLHNNAELLICGKVNNDELKKRIEDSVEGIDNIKLKLHFLSDEELGSALAGCDATVLPYEKDSMQNSGSAIMSISAGKATVIPIFGYIKDIADKDFIISYDYKNKKEQVENLRNAMIEFCEKNKKDPDYAHRVGEEAKRFAVDELDWDNIMAKVAKRYNDCFRV